MIIATEQAPTAAPEAEQETKYQYKREVDGIFRHKKTEWLHERPTINGKRTWRSLNTKNLKLGKEEYYKRRAAVARGENPYAEVEKPAAATQTSPVTNGAAQANHPTTVNGLPAQNNTSSDQQEQSKAKGLIGDALRRYSKDDCPDKHRKKRPTETVKAEKTNIEILLPFWDKVDPEKVTIAVCDKYHDARVGKDEPHDARVQVITRGEGDRTVDLELNTLRNAIRYGCRCEIMDHMPLPEGWPRYHPASAVVHCRKFMAHDADEVHEIGRLLYGHGKTKVLFDLLQRTSHPPIESLLCWLERLPENVRSTLVNGMCRCNPRLDHPYLSHEPAQCARLRTLISRPAGLTLIAGDSDRVRTFVLAALGHEAVLGRLCRRPLCGLDLHSPRWFVPIDGVLYLNAPPLAGNRSQGASMLEYSRPLSRRTSRHRFESWLKPVSLWPTSECHLTTASLTAVRSSQT